MNLVLGTALTFTIDKVELFVKSFRKHNKRDRVILLVSLESPPDFFEFLKLYDIEYSFFQSYNFFDTHINNSRFYKYMDVILDSGQKFDKIFLTDTRDIVFQSDVFNNTPQDFLYFFEEEKESRIGENIYNSNWIEMTFGIDVLQEMFYSTIICAGTTLGSRQKIIDYVNTMLEIFNLIRKNNKEVYKINIDQGIHNFIYYKTNHIKELIAKNNGNIVGTIGLTREINPSKLEMRKDGMYVHGMKPAVIHQYDRSKEFTNYFHSLNE